MKGLDLCKPSFQVQLSEISTDFLAGASGQTQERQ